MCNRELPPLCPVRQTAGEDFTVGSSDVLLHEGETYKAVPVYIISDISPELEETFTVQLIDEITGGARLGAVSSAIVTIEPSDDPFGYFGKCVSFCANS